MGSCYPASMYLHAKHTAYCTMNIETRMDIGAEIVYANTGVLQHIDDETRVRNKITDKLP